MHEMIRNDLQAFADPGTPVLVEGNTAVWEQSGEERSISFGRSSAGALQVESSRGKRYSYRQFLAGPEMADLMQLAAFMLRRGAQEPGFIETSAAWEEEDEETSVEAAATKLIALRSTTELPAFSTRVVLVQGEAGSGKTVALRQLTHRQAELYQRGEANQLFFYVDAQGRALSRLEDAMAKDLQDLRSRFSYSAIAPLTRNQLIVPIIDGFDELLGSGGYDEAFSSLAALLSMLNGQGAIIASARSSFFDYQNFYDNAEKFSHRGTVNYEVDVVRVKPWSSEQVEEYVANIATTRGHEQDDAIATLQSVVEGLSESNRELISKPFYAAKLTDLILSNVSIESQDALLDQLVRAFLKREHRKLLDKEGNPLLSVEGHHKFLALLADEMWWQESKRLDVRTIQAAAEMIVEDYKLPPGSAQAIVERVSSYAFLSTSDSKRHALRFEHEVLYGYFLAHQLELYVADQASVLRRFLNRALLDESLADQAARVFGSNPEDASRTATRLCSALSSRLTDVVARENAGRMVGALVARVGALVPGTEVKNAIFKQVRLGPADLPGIRFIECDFEDADLRETVLTDPVFEGCDIRSIIVDLNSTRLDGANSDLLSQVYSVQVQTGDEVVRPGHYYAPRDISTVLTQLGADLGADGSDEASYSEDVSRRIEVIDRFTRKMERRFYASEADLQGFSFTGTATWRVVRNALEETGLLVEEFIQKSGPHEPLFRLSVPPDVVRQGEKRDDPTLPVEVRRFWAMITNVE